MTESPTTVARLTCDGKDAARQIADYLGESLDPADTVCTAFEHDDGSWQVALHFGTQPDQQAVRDLVATAAGDAAAQALTFESVAAMDWVAESLSGLTPVRAGRFIVHGAHDRLRIKTNDLAIEIEAALAFGTGHHGTTRGCLLALADLAKRRRFARVLDLGTGSGALLLSVVAETKASGVGTDFSPAALAVAHENADLLGLEDRVRFHLLDWREDGWAATLGQFDIVLCNPPYIEESAVLDPDVRDHEPATALFAGADGLDDYRLILPRLRDLLAPDGLTIVEIGHEQAEAVGALAKENGFAFELRRDLANRPRALILR